MDKGEGYKKPASRASDAIARETGKRFCTNCQQEKSLAGGYWKATSRTRWVCADCRAKR